MGNPDEETYGAGEMLGGCFVGVMILGWIVLLCYVFVYFVNAGVAALSHFPGG